MYDIEVEEDASFVASGLTVHNSNCRDRLVVRTGTQNEIRRAYQGYTKSQHQGVLDMIKRDRKRLKPSDIRMIAQKASSGLSRP